MIYRIKYNSNKIYWYLKKNMIIWSIKLPYSTNKIKLILNHYKLGFKSLKKNKFKINRFIKISWHLNRKIILFSWISLKIFLQMF